MTNVKEKKNKKDIYVIVVCLFLLFISLGAIIVNKRENNQEEKPKEKIQEPEKEKEEPVNNKFADYEISDNNFRKDTNQDIKVLFDEESINENDVLKISNSMTKGYLYLLERKKTGTVYMKDLTSKELGVLTAEFLYTTQSKVCTDMSFMEELLVLLYGDVDINFELDSERYNEYNNSYCLIRENNNYKYHLVYDNHTYTKDYVTISYRKIVDNNNEGIMKVYFRSKDNSYYFEKIDL